MRIVIWNCAMGLHRKWDRIMELRPDVAIIAECAQPGVVRSKRDVMPECDAQWIGDNPHKGLGVFVFGRSTLRRDETYNDRLKHFLPVVVSGELDISILAVWAFNRRARANGVRVEGSPVAALEHYGKLIDSGSTIVAGDFNNCVRWDRPGKPTNFAAIAGHLAERGLGSAYHAVSGFALGAEDHSTFFHRKGAIGYHIDYCFVPPAWATQDAAIGRRDDWIDISDHVPLIVDCQPEEHG